MFKNVVLNILLLIVAFQVKAQEQTSIGKSPKATLMGNAYTAIAEDEYSLFYNPALLGRNKSVSFNPINPQFSVTNALESLDKFKDFPKSDPVAIANRILDVPLTLEASIMPGLKMGNFGFNLLASNKTNIVLKNAIHPALDINYRYDRGFIFGYAYTMGSGAMSSRPKKSKKTSTTNGKRISIGAAVKRIEREGIQDQYDLFGTTLLNTVNSGATSIDEIKRALGYTIGVAWGGDLGIDYVQSSGRSTFSAGFSMLDIGDLQFRKTEGTGNVPMQEMTTNLGFGYKQDLGIIDYTLSADFKPLLSGVDWERKMHFGVELSLPLFTFYGGWNEGYLSYGTSFYFWPFKVTAGFYGVEIGAKYKEREAKRAVIYLSLFDFSFDI
jgi:hypothetical protein